MWEEGVKSGEGLRRPLRGAWHLRLTRCASRWPETRKLLSRPQIHHKSRRRDSSHRGTDYGQHHKRLHHGSSTAAQQATQATQTRPLSSYMYGMTVPMREVTGRALCSTHGRCTRFSRPASAQPVSVRPRPHEARCSA